MKYWYYAKLSFINSTAYRFEMMASILLGPFSILIQYFIWSSLLSLQETIAGYDIVAAMTYFTIVTLVNYFTYNGNFTNFDKLIVEGELSKELLRPIKLLPQRLAMVLGNRAMALLLEVVPILILIGVFFGLDALLPTSPAAFSAGILIAVLMKYLWDYIVAITTFWTKQGHGTRMINWSIYLFASGFAFPLDILPANLQTISAYLPFQHFVFAPVKYFGGSFTLGPVADATTNLLLGAAWILVLLLIAKVIEYRGLAKYQGVGQ